MKEKATITAKSLKHFLKLFDENSPIKVNELGDTWHPRSGFVDEGILENPGSVQDVMEINYDFNGLVLFDARIGDFKVDLLPRNGEEYEFQMSGESWKLREFENRVLAKNALKPGEYRFLG